MKLKVEMQRSSTIGTQLAAIARQLALLNEGKRKIKVTWRTIPSVITLAIFMNEIFSSQKNSSPEEDWDPELQDSETKS